MAAIELETRYDLADPVDGHNPSAIVGELYEQHHRMVRALCRLLLRNASDTDDAVQQTFLSAYRSLLSGTQPECPAAWLAVIARRECWARTEKRGRQPVELDESIAVGETGDVLAVAIQNADLAEMWNAIKELPSQQRQVFLLREFSGLSYDELGEALGATESAVEALLVRARRQLRGRLQPVLKVANAATLPLWLLGRLRRLVERGDRAAVSTAETTTASVPLAAAGVPIAFKLSAMAATSIVAVGGAVAATGRGLPLLGASAKPAASSPSQAFPSAFESGSVAGAGRTATGVNAFVASLGDFAQGAMPFTSIIDESAVATAAPADGSPDAAPSPPIDPGAPDPVATTPDPVAEPAPAPPPAAAGDPSPAPTVGGPEPTAGPDATPPAGPDPAADPTPVDPAASPDPAPASPDTSADPTPTPDPPPPAAELLPDPNAPTPAA
jgi:RNA polymerase sigma factor (sigma-70 family)